MKTIKGRKQVETFKILPISYPIIFPESRSLYGHRQVPEELRVPGLVVSFLNQQSKVEKWTYQGGTWAAVSFIRQEAGGNKILEWNTDAATTRKQVPANERKAGMQISYKDADGDWVNEQYIGTAVTAAEWAKDGNWSPMLGQLHLERISNALGLSANQIEIVMFGKKIDKDGLISDAPYWNVLCVDVDYITITQLSFVIDNPNWGDHSVVAYYDRYMNFIKGSNILNNNADKTVFTLDDVKIPESAKFMTLCIRVGGYWDDMVYKSQWKAQKKGIMQRIDNIMNILPFLGVSKFALYSTDKGYLDEDSFFVPDSSGLWDMITVDLFNVTLSDVSFKVQGAGLGGQSVISFFDARGNLISNINNKDPEFTHVDINKVKPPLNTRFVKFSIYGNRYTIRGESLPLHKRVDNSVVLIDSNTGVKEKFSAYSNKTLGFCGDSLTDGYEAYYKGYAQRLANSGIFKKTYNVAKGGAKISDVLNTQLPKLKETCPGVDIISISVCTNDFTEGRAVGEWYSSEPGQKRVYNTTDDTMKAYVNKIMLYIRENFPFAKVIWLTPIRKANWLENGNVDFQGDDLVSKNGVYLSDYRRMLLDTEEVWGCACMDMWYRCQLDPHIEGHRQTFFDGIRTVGGSTAVDGVHVGPKGGERMYEAYLGYLIQFESN